MDWLSEIEEDNRRAQKVRDKRVSFSSKERPRVRMARVLRELAGLIKAMRIVKFHEMGIDTVKIGKARLALEDIWHNLSDDAKELCVAARESSRE